MHTHTHQDTQADAHTTDTESATLTLGQLLARRNALDKQIQDLQSSAKAEAIAKVRDIMAEAGLTAADLGLAAPAATAIQHKSTPAKERPSKVPAKYRNPATGETWSGRGLKPKWLAQALAEGKSLEEFLIADAA